MKNQHKNMKNYSIRISWGHKLHTTVYSPLWETGSVLRFSLWSFPRLLRSSPRLADKGFADREDFHILVLGQEFPAAAGGQHPAASVQEIRDPILQHAFLIKGYNL